MSRAPFSTSYQNQNQSFSPRITQVLIGSLHSLLWGLLLVWVYNRQLKLHSKSSEVNYNSTPRVFLWREIPGPFSREARNPSRKFWNQNMLNSSTVPSSQTGQFCFVNWWLHYLIFKVTETLILNANTANVKELFGPEKLSGLSRKGPPDGQMSCPTPVGELTLALFLARNSLITSFSYTLFSFPPQVAKSPKLRRLSRDLLLEILDAIADHLKDFNLAVNSWQSGVYLSNVWIHIFRTMWYQTFRAGAGHSVTMSN